MSRKLTRREVLAAAGTLAVGVAASQLGEGLAIAGDDTGRNMVITTLVENYFFNDDLKCRHGLSLLVQLDNGPTVLFDAGPDDALLFNMSVLKQNLADVDYIVISHGHHDHGGGLQYVFENNTKARAYLHEQCKNAFFTREAGKMRNIGFFDQSLPEERMSFVTGDKEINPRLQIFTGFERSGFFPTGNRSLYVQKNGGSIVPDTFNHEIALLIRAQDNNVLITGCSHSGIGNIVRSVLQRSGLKKIEHVIGGFHLTTPSSGQSEPPEKLQQLVDELNQYPDTRFYTCHCTGKKQIKYLASRLTPELVEINTGSILKI